MFWVKNTLRRGHFTRAEQSFADLRMPDLAFDAQIFSQAFIWSLIQAHNIRIDECSSNYDQVPLKVIRAAACWIWAKIVGFSPVPRHRGERLSAH